MRISKDMPIVSQISRLIPVFAGQLLLIFPATEYLHLYLRRILLFLLLISAWKLIRFCANYRRGLSSLDRHKSLICLGGIGAGLALMLTSLTLLRNELQQLLFIILVAVLMCRGMADNFIRRREIVTAATAAFIAHTGIAAFSVYLSSLQWNWQMLVYAASIGFIVLASDLAFFLSVQAKPVLTAHRFWSLGKSYLFSLIFAPLSISALVYSGQLPRHYLLVLLLLPVAKDLLSRIYDFECGKPLPDGFLFESRVLVLSFSVLILICSMV